MNKLILISGKAENGKTTTANYLKERLESKGYKVVIMRYAYYLKDLAKRCCGWNGIKDEKGRELLQYLGTDIIRLKLNKPDFHVFRVCEDIEICQDYFDYAIIDDARFVNEIEMPKKLFGDKVITMRIERYENGKPYNSHLTEAQKKHLSEIALDNYKFDITIKASTLEELYKEIENDRFKMW